VWGPFFTDDEEAHDEDGGGSYSFKVMTMMIIIMGETFSKT